jgi:hypothetical protein
MTERDEAVRSRGLWPDTLRMIADAPPQWANNPTLPDFLRAVADAIAAIPSQAEWRPPEGWALVPIEPTREMRQAGADAEFEAPMLGEGVTACVGKARAISAYRAMISAAPAPPVSP